MDPVTPRRRRAIGISDQFCGLRARRTGTPMMRMAAPAQRMSSFMVSSLGLREKRAVSNEGSAPRGCGNMHQANHNYFFANHENPQSKKSGFINSINERQFRLIDKAQSKARHCVGFFYGETT
jgi:hypothetical protein